MSRVQLNKAFQSSLNSEALTQKLTSFLEEKKFKISTNENDLIVAKQGSQFISRLIGFMLSPVGFLPKMITLKTKKIGDKVEVEAIMDETVGFGILDPLSKKKYSKYFESVLADLEKVLS
jgi:hypothetical protein